MHGWMLSISKIIKFFIPLQGTIGNKKGYFPAQYVQVSFILVALRLINCTIGR